MYIKIQLNSFKQLKCYQMSCLDNNDRINDRLF